MCALRNISCIIYVAAALFVSGCGSETVVTQVDDDVLVSVGDSTLTVSDVLARIPRGMAPEDSAALFDKIVADWVRDLVLSDFAEKNVPDLDRIERLTEAYRNDLIVNSYLQSMSDASVKEISEDRIREYYDTNRSSMILEQPIIKGAFLKVADADENIDKLRSWMQEFSDASIDKIEEAGLKHASQYQYFKDEWIEWNAIAEQIPYRFFDADAFVTSSRNFETSEGGSTYLLHISEYLPSGKEMPYEFAKVKIQKILQSLDINTYREKLVTDIYKAQIKDGVLKPGICDPLEGVIKTTKSKQTTKN